MYEEFEMNTGLAFLLLAGLGVGHSTASRVAPSDALPRARSEVPIEANAWRFACLDRAFSGPATSLPWMPDDWFDESVVLALEISQQLVAPAELVSQVAADLRAIRAAYPGMQSIRVRPSWVPGQLIIQLTTLAWADRAAGRYHGLDSLDAVYGPVAVTDSIPDFQVLLLTFAQPYNSPLLVNIYRGAEGIETLQANHVLGGGDDVFSASGTYTGVYTFQKAWGDCERSCQYKHLWVFAVSEGAVELVQESGDPLAVEARSWSDMKRAFR
jgi:hypothetical protein